MSASRWTWRIAVVVTLIGSLAIISRGGQCGTVPTVTRVGDTTLRPALVFPPGSRVRAIEVRRGDGTQAEDGAQAGVGYVVRSGVGWQETIGFYKRAYQGAHVRWIGLRHGRLAGTHFALVVLPEEAGDTLPDLSIVLYKDVGDNGAHAMGLSRQETRGRVIIYALVTPLKSISSATQLNVPVPDP